MNNNNILSKNISNVSDCYGCGVCAISCPQKLISINLNDNGFWGPQIAHNEKCVKCGLCLENCAYIHNNLPVSSVPISAYAAWSNSEKIRIKCSSGGVCLEICKYYINLGYKICGVSYDCNSNIAAHVICSSEKELSKIAGSKYIPSYTINGFEHFCRQEKFVVIGTPCQIDSVRRYIRQRKIEENFVLIDFFCHGVPSMKLWTKFSESQKNKIGRFLSVTWRNKKDGWHKSYRLDIIAENGEYHHSGLKFDDFFGLYFSNSALSPACFDKCKYKQLQSSADIRIGDMWGENYKNDKNGVSSVICFTEIGEATVHNIKCTIKRHNIYDILDGQMNELPKRNEFFYRLNPLIINKNGSWNRIIFLYRILNLKKRLKRKLNIITNGIKKIINR